MSLDFICTCVNQHDQDDNYISKVIEVAQHQPFNRRSRFLLLAYQILFSTC